MLLGGIAYRIRGLMVAKAAELGRMTQGEAIKKLRGSRYFFQNASREAKKYSEAQICQAMMAVTEAEFAIKSGRMRGQGGGGFRHLFGIRRQGVEKDEDEKTNPSRSVDGRNPCSRVDASGHHPHPSGQRDHYASAGDDIGTLTCGLGVGLVLGGVFGLSSVYATSLYPAIRSGGAHSGSKPRSGGGHVPGSPLAGSSF